MVHQLGGAVLRHLVHELEPVLEGSWLDNLYQLDRTTFLLRFRGGGQGRRQLLLPLEGVPHLSTHTFSTPATPTQAATVLRKRLRQSRLVAVRQQGLDRILHLEFQTREGDRELVLELLRPTNLLLVQGGLITWVLKPRDHRHRSLRPGRPYQPPPGGFDPTGLSSTELHETLTRSLESLGRSLAVELNLGPDLARELLAGLGLKADDRYGQLDPATQTALLKAIRDHLDTSSGRPHLYLSGDRPEAVLPWVSNLHREAEAHPLQTLSEGFALLQALTDREHQEAREPGRQELARRDRRAEQQAAAALAYQERSQRLQQAGFLLFERYDLVQRMLETLRREIADAGWEALQARAPELPGLVAVDPAHHLVRVRLESVELELDLGSTLEQNATRLFDRAKRLAAKARRAREAETQTRARPVPIDQPPPVSLETPPLWFERYRWFVTTAGNITVAGKDARTNETVVRRYLKEHDVFCHADLTGAPAVVVKHHELTVTEAAAREGCLFSLAYSKAWGARVAAGHTYWTTADQVSKTPRAGEFVAKGAFIIRGQRHWHRNQPVEAGVGWISMEGVERLMGGPVPAIEHHCRSHVILRPGYLERLEVVKTLARAFKAPPETLERVLPPGPCDLVRQKGCDVEWPE